MIETVGSRHDGHVGEELANPAYILVQDRAYGKIERFYRYQVQGQSFAIRLQENVHLVSPQELSHPKAERSFVQGYLLFSWNFSFSFYAAASSCGFSGWAWSRHSGRYRFMTVSAEQITDMYKSRWQVELFFRWIKQHLNVPTLFGKTKSVVFGQFYSALLVYVLLKFFYDMGNAIIPSHSSPSFVTSSRLLLHGQFPKIWLVQLSFFKEEAPSFYHAKH